jgi:hypothetical protein
VVALEAGAHDVMMAWEPPGGAGRETLDPSVRVVPIASVLDETMKLLDGTSQVIQKRMELLRAAEDLLPR